MDWYYSKNNAQHGPVRLEELQSKIRNGEISPESLVWRDGMSDWAAATTVPGILTTQVSITPAPANVYSAPGTPVPANYPPLASARPTSGLAIASLVFGVLGITACMLPGILAIVFGHMAMGPTHPEKGNMSGRGLAVAGLILGYLSAAILILFVMFFFVAAVTA